MRGRGGLAASALSIAILTAALAVSARVEDDRPSLSATAGSLPKHPDDGIGRLVGPGSCANRGCHGGIDPADPAIGRVLGNEYTTWLTRDPHAGAFDVLLSPRSQGIAERLATGDSDPKPAHQDARCLACHATQSDPVRPLAAESGVSCESCHGPAGGWLTAHTSTDWADRPVADKANFGMTSVAGLTDRVRTCAGCHVGSAAGSGITTRDVNHDLIAAGHPRMAFEASWFGAVQPKHWRDEHDRAATPEGAALLWAIGQHESAAAALELLADRASDESRPWPELAEYDCWGCHHDLAPEGWRLDAAKGGRRVGQPSWSTWTTALLPELLGTQDGDNNSTLDGLKSLRMSMESGNADRRQVVATARDLAKQLRDRGRLIETSGETSDLARWLATVLIEPDEPTWAFQVQRFLALDVLRRAPVATTDAKRAESELNRLADELGFPESYQSPKGYDPAGGPDNSSGPAP